MVSGGCQGHSRVSLAFWGPYVAVRTTTVIFICFKSHIFFANFSTPYKHTEKVLYSNFAYGSQFSGEKNYLKIQYLVAEILSEHGVLFFLGHPVLPHSAPSWILSQTENLASSSLQDGATKW